jgi:hypothetical protein
MNLVFALLLISVNVSVFLLLDSNFNISIRVDKRRVLIFLIPIVVLVVILLILNLDEYRMSFNMSAALVTLMVLRLVIHKVITIQPENANNSNRIIQRFFNTVVFPFFVVFISFAQCLYLLVWN